MSDTQHPSNLAGDFKSGMRRLASTITIIASAHQEEWSGMVATAVSAVSADPPSLVIGVNQNASLHHPVSAGELFSVNLLATQHSHLVRPFSGALKGADRFALGNWKLHETGMPYLADAMVNFLCKVDAKLEYGSHTLFIGSVQAIHINGDAAPLIWQDGGFASTIPLD
ncbi:flavin reductase family protein [Granulicella sibirica]|uniref:4-hydroxyphenylacetate 3-monooxygenase, reductase component n=1 Tax=Granulicella sibirica TaxID=2479048 RepID=A0A4Q0SVB8_9BACT|nr:flavin reductase family protein [Granulicella sibirica]RXH54717.1 4-hydroxyphenylacetate 3-monooxygenase, reductase component [Granulicella sibirica]